MVKYVCIFSKLYLYIIPERCFSFTVSTENLAKDPWTCNCLSRSKADSQETLAVEDSPPQCPHNGVHGSTTCRSPSPVSTCPTPKPFLIFTDSAHGWVLCNAYNTIIFLVQNNDHYNVHYMY